ncbi:hypothetical protein J4225_03815 [Candidatus Pacearchaeota archaeon]|nr:hypothetical protein [Candidatus Pacearchaeota archaeon]
MNKQQKVIILIIILTAIASFTSIIIISNAGKTKIVHMQEMPLNVKVSDYLGINTDPDLNFGAGMPGNKLTKDLTILNPFDFDVKVAIAINGNIKDFAVISENNFNILSMQNKTLNLTIDIPKNAEIGNYTGILKVSMIRE